jgi:hypothetical protein
MTGERMSARIGLLLGMVGCDYVLPPDETTTDTGTTDPVQHPACAEPLDPATLEPPPASNLADPAGRPAFDRWRDIDCDIALAAVETCSETDPCSGDVMCLQGTAGGTGVCASSQDVDIWCDGEGEAMGYLDDQCWVCVSDEVHAAACCLDPSVDPSLDGAFDCRAWPYPANGVPGTVCMAHGDCEPGLECGDHAGEGYGICQCPGLNPTSVSPPDVCW